MKLLDGIERYLIWKHANGYLFERGESTLLAFSRQTGDIQLVEIASEDVSKFLNIASVSTITWRQKYWTLHRFFQYWSARDAMPELKFPVPRPSVRQAFIPHVFTVAELKRLLEVVSNHKKSILGIDPLTLRIIILFLYATGVAVGESTRILLEDVDLQNEFIEIRGARAHRSRRIPIGKDLIDVLTEYIACRSPTKIPSPTLFSTKDGLPLCSEALSKSFGRLRALANTHRYDGSRFQPRISDLRFTFAVHRITDWIVQGIDLNRMLPSLAAYMGQVGLGSTERYLFMTPERFRKDLNKLSPTQGKPRWVNDPELMRFLASL